MNYQTHLKDKKFQGTVKSALQRIRKELKAAGYDLGRTEGRYHPFGPEQKIIPGMTAHRIGCSRSIAIDYHSRIWTESDADKVERHRIEHEAWDMLRSKGLPIDQRGWMECLYY